MQVNYLSVFDLSYNSDRHDHHGHPANEMKQNGPRIEAEVKLKKILCSTKHMSSMILMLIQYERMNNGLLVKYVET